MKILNMALTFGDMPDLTASEMDILKGVDTIPLRPGSKKEFNSLVKQANIIAIDSKHLLNVTENNLATNALTEQVGISNPEMAELPVCPPFRCQWIELSYSNAGAYAPSFKVNGHVITILGMLINETSPNTYDIYTFESQENPRGIIKKFSILRNVNGLRPNDSLMQMNFAVWIKAINSGSLGMEECEDVVMLPKENGKKDSKKKPHPIRRIVRIVPRNSKHKTEPLTPGGKVDFSHRWEVRGHWRRVNGIGKDRDGNYSIRGLTWVTNCVKGPEEQPLIKKMRWVPGQASHARYNTT